MKDFPWKTITVLGAVATILTIFSFLTGITSLGQLYKLFINESEKQYSSTKQLNTKFTTDIGSITKLRSKHEKLSESDVKKMLLKYSFFLQ